MPEPVNTPIRRKSAGKSEAMLNDCIYQIAAGIWSPGQRLPPLREAKQRWGVTEVTCFRVYRRLVGDGLVVPRDRGGYFVAGGDSVARLGQRQAAFRQLFDWFEKGLAQHPLGTAFSTLGAARAIVQMAESQGSDNPECAFVECTQFQAESHAAEVREKLRVPCGVLTTHDLAAGRVMSSVRFLLTAPFHLAEVKRIAAKLRIAALHVAIEIAPSLLQSLRRSRAEEIVVFGLKTGLAANVASDLRARLPGDRRPFRARASDTTKLERQPLMERGATKRMFILSPSLWAGAGPEIQARSDVRPLEYRIVPSAWESVERLLGMPAGVSALVEEENPVLAHC